MKALIILCSFFWMVTYTSRPMISAGMEHRSEKQIAQDDEHNDGQEGETVYTEANLMALVPGPGPVIHVIFQVLFIAVPSPEVRVPEQTGTPLMVSTWLHVMFCKISPAKAP